MENHCAFCADVGSIPKDKFGWASFICGNWKTRTSIVEFASDIADAIKSEGKVSIGFECPMFVPVRDASEAVALKRTGEGRRPWSAGAGANVLATGMVQSLWVLRKVKEILGYAPQATFDWKEFEKTNSVFFWEAFVSGAPNENHCAAAMAALRQFLVPGNASAIQEPNVMSLIGACALRAEWSKDITLLWKPCLVIKPSSPHETEKIVR